MRTRTYAICITSSKHTKNTPVDYYLPCFEAVAVASGCCTDHTAAGHSTADVAAVAGSPADETAAAESRGRGRGGWSHRHER